MPTRTYRPIHVATLASGMDLVLPLHEIVGDKPGPTLGISAGIHGEEAVGVEVVYRFMQSLDPSALRGRLLVLPVANPSSYAAISRHTPIDGGNLNRLFPGHRDGQLTEQLAFVMSEQFLRRIDNYVDLHAGGAYPTVDYVYILNAEPLSRAFGSPLLYRAKETLAGTSVTVTTERNVPSVVVELGGGDVEQTTYVARGLHGEVNIRDALRMLRGGSRCSAPSTPGRCAGRSCSTPRRRSARCRPCRSSLPYTGAAGPERVWSGRRASALSPTAMASSSSTPTHSMATGTTGGETRTSGLRLRGLTTSASSPG